jgi:hypothetical protein
MAERTDEWDDRLILEAWRKAIGPFVEGSKATMPNVKFLAGLLRSTVPLPDDFRNILADMLDTLPISQLHCNWQLRPHFTGGRDRESVRIERETRINDLLDEKPGRRSEAIQEAAEAIGVCEKTAWDILRKQNDRLAWWDKLLTEIAPPMTDEQKAEFLALIRRL